MTQLEGQVEEEIAEKETLEIKDEIESLLEETNETGLIPDNEAQNLEEVLEKRRAWSDYSGVDGSNHRGTFGAFSLIGSAGILSDVIGYTENGAVGAFFAVPGVFWYSIEKRSYNKTKRAKNNIESIDECLEDCYVFDGSYDLSEIGGEVLDVDGLDYQNLQNLAVSRKKAREEALEELDSDYHLEDWEDDWSSFVRGDRYEDGLQVLWIDEKELENSDSDVFSWKIEFYNREGNGLYLLHESYGSSTSENLSEIKSDGRNVSNMTSNFERLFNITNTGFFDHQHLKHRFTKPC